MKAKTKTTKKTAASKAKKPVKKVAKKPAKSVKPAKKKVSKINKKDNEIGAKIVDLLKNTLAPTSTLKAAPSAPATRSKSPVATIGTCTQAQVKSVTRFSATPVVKTRFVAAGVSPKTNLPVTLVASK